MADWHGLRVYGVRLALPVPLPGVYPGHFLRGVLGRALFDTVCPFSARGDDRLCSACALRERCAYPRAFKPVDPERLAPCWLHGWASQPGGLVVSWSVLEAARPHLEPWLHGLRRRFPGLRAWDAVSGAELAGSPGAAGVDLQPLPEPARPGSDCVLRMVTPLVSKHANDPLHGALRTRAQRLILQYGDGARLPVEDPPWQLQVLDGSPVAMSLGRRRVEGHYYRFGLSSITPAGADLLAWGRRLHAGGHVSIGCGAYRLEAPA